MSLTNSKPVATIDEKRASLSGNSNVVEASSTVKAKLKQNQVVKTQLTELLKKSVLTNSNGKRSNARTR